MRRLLLILLCVLCCNIAVGQNRRKAKQKDSTEFGSQPVDVEKIVVSGKRKTGYSKKDNPAVELARRIIASRDSINPFLTSDFTTYDRYEKIVISLDNFKGADSGKALSFLNDHAILNSHSGRKVLPLSVREKIVTTTRQRSPKAAHHTTLLEHNEGLDDRFSQGTVLAFLNDAIPELDIFADNIYLVQRQFISPVSTGAIGFYKFYLSPDTIVYRGERCVELEFFPFSKNSLSLRGRLIVTADSTQTPFVHFAQISIPNSADINFLSNLVIEQNFVRDSAGRRLITTDDVNFDLAPIKGVKALNIQRTNQFSDYSFVDPSTVPARTLSTDTTKFKRTKQETMVSRLVRRLREMPLFRVAEEVLLILTDGYFQTGRKSYFDIGPIAQFISGNTLEGTRLALGGMTTPNLNKHIFFDGIVAYGFDDRKVKYNVSLEYSFPKRKEHFKEFPVNSLRATYAYDVRRFGQRFDVINAESIFTWAKRSGDYHLTYIQLAQLRYMREFESNFSFSIYARHYREFESRVMNFAPTAGALPSYAMAEAEVRLRYAPGEKIYQTRLQRRSLNKYVPTLELSHVSGFKGLLGGNYTRNHTEFETSGRINIQPLGYIDFNARIGAEWNTVPYMLLPHPSTNMSCVMGNDRSFSLMQPLEFLYDKYGYIGISYYMDGLIFSRIPLIKYLSLREVFTFRGVYGHLSNRNNPAFNTDILPFPTGSSAMGREPYMEVGVGIDNILGFFRLDYVWRLTYLNGLNVQHGALLFDFKIKF